MQRLPPLLRHPLGEDGRTLDPYLMASVSSFLLLGDPCSREGCLTTAITKENAGYVLQELQKYRWAKADTEVTADAASRVLKEGCAKISRVVNYFEQYRAPTVWLADHFQFLSEPDGFATSRLTMHALQAALSRHERLHTVLLDGEENESLAHMAVLLAIRVICTDERTLWNFPSLDRQIERFRQDERTVFHPDFFIPFLLGTSGLPEPSLHYHVWEEHSSTYGQSPLWKDVFRLIVWTTQFCEAWLDKAKDAIGLCMDAVDAGSVDVVTCLVTTPGWFLDLLSHEDVETILSHFVTSGHSLDVVHHATDRVLLTQEAWNMLLDRVIQQRKWDEFLDAVAMFYVGNSKNPLEIFAKFRDFVDSYMKDADDQSTYALQELMRRLNKLIMKTHRFEFDVETLKKWEQTLRERRFTYHHRRLDNALVDGEENESLAKDEKTLWEFVALDDAIGRFKDDERTVFHPDFFIPFLLGTHLPNPSLHYHVWSKHSSTYGQSPLWNDVFRLIVWTTQFCEAWLDKAKDAKGLCMYAVDAGSVDVVTCLVTTPGWFLDLLSHEDVETILSHFVTSGHSLDVVHHATDRVLLTQEAWNMLLDRVIQERKWDELLNAVAMFYVVNSENPLEMGDFVDSYMKDADDQSTYALQELMRRLNKLKMKRHRFDFNVKTLKKWEQTLRERRSTYYLRPPNSFLSL